jgi:hypothetical protein
MEQKKRRGGTQHFEDMLNTKKQKLACNPDLGPAVVLSAPRSAFPAYSQPPGASRSPPGLKSKNSIKHPQKHLYIYIYI